jgi:hypothetical protein
MKERPRVQGDMFMSLMPGNEGMDIMLSREKRKHVSAAETGLTNCSKVHNHWMHNHWSFCYLRARSSLNSQSLGEYFYFHTSWVFLGIRSHCGNPPRLKLQLSVAAPFAAQLNNNKSSRKQCVSRRLQTFARPYKYHPLLPRSSTRRGRSYRKFSLSIRPLSRR